MVAITISEVNSLSDDNFDATFGNVIELCSDAAVYVKDKRPFNSVSDLCDEFYTYLDQLSVQDKVEVLKLHPDLAGSLAARGELTKESAEEQRAAGLEQLTPQMKNTMNEYNRRYKEKFGFPFIICAKENKIQSIIHGLQNRYNNSYEEEINTGINEVKKICRLRILDIVKNCY